MQAYTLGKLRRAGSHEMRAQIGLAAPDLPVVELLLRHRLYRRRIQVIEQVEEHIEAMHRVRELIDLACQCQQPSVLGDHEIQVLIDRSSMRVWAKNVWTKGTEIDRVASGFATAEHMRR